MKKRNKTIKLNFFPYFISGVVKILFYSSGGSVRELTVILGAVDWSRRRRRYN